MPQKGRLTRAKLGYSMPATSPLYGKPPVHYRAREALNIRFETDADAALEILPELLELPDNPMATLGIQKITDSSLGSYYESYLALDALWMGEPRRYCALIVMTPNDAALVWGREVTGAPKKFGDVSLERSGEGVFGYVDRPKGVRLVTAGILRDEWHDPAEMDFTFTPFVCLRVQIQPRGAEPDVAVELIETPTDSDVIEYWTGTGTLDWGVKSDIDNWSVLPINRITQASFMTMHSRLHWPNLLARM